MRRLTKKGKERARLAARGEEHAVFDYSLVPLTKSNHHRAKNDLPPVAHLNGRRVMAQSFNLPARSSQSGFILGLGNSSLRSDEVQPKASIPIPQIASFGNNGYANDFENIDYTVFASPAQTPSRSRQYTRRESQWKTWTTKVLPGLHAVYLNLLFRTESLRRDPPEITRQDCTCDNTKQRKLTVVVVKFTGRSI